MAFQPRQLPIGQRNASFLRHLEFLCNTYSCTAGAGCQELLLVVGGTDGAEPVDGKIYSARPLHGAFDSSKARVWENMKETCQTAVQRGHLARTLVIAFVVESITTPGGRLRQTRV